jgi:hypothetical protein
MGRTNQPLPALVLGAILTTACSSEPTTMPDGGTPDGGTGPATLQIGAASIDITPPAFATGMVPDAFKACDAKYTGPRQFAFEEPYVDTANAGHFVSGDDFCDTNNNGVYDGIYLAGGSDNNRIVAQVLDPVSARAVVFGSEDGKHHVAVVSVDSLGLLANTINKIAILAKTMRPGLDEVLVSSTHTESAPDPVGLWGPDQMSSGVNTYYLDYLAQQAAAAVVQAYDAAEPAHLRFARGAQPASFRPIWSSYPFVHDPTIMSMQAVSAKDPKKVLFTLANYNFHAEIYGFSKDPMLSRALSADWPGVFRKEIESKYGGVAIALAGLVGSVEMPEVYPNGAVPQAPIAPVNTTMDEDYTVYDAPPGQTPLPKGTTEVADAIGKAVAQSVVSAFDKSPDQWSRTGEVRALVSPLCFAVENQDFLLAFQVGIIKRVVGCNGSIENTASSLAIVDAGDMQMAFVPGEVFPFTLQRGFLGADDMPFPDQAMTAWAAAAMTGKWTFFAGLGQDGVGYFMPAADFVGLSDEVTIEPWASWDMTSAEYDRFGWGHGDDGESLGPHAASVLADGLVDALKQLHPEGAPDTKVATGRFVDEDGATSRSPFPSASFKGAIGVWVLPDGATDFTPGTGSIYALAGHEKVGAQTIAGTIGGFLDLHGLPEESGYTLATRGVWLPGSDANAPSKRIFVDVYPGK